MRPITSFLAVLSVLVGSICSLSQAAEKAPNVKTIEIGTTAPAFKLTGVDDKEYSLESFKEAKYLVVIFTCNHCPDARASWGRINQFAKDYADKGVQVVAISSNSPKALMLWENGYSLFGDSFPEMKLEATERKLVFPYLYDGDTQETGLAYGAMATPHTFIFGPKRKLLYQGQFDNGQRNPGPATKNVVKDSIDDLLAGKSLEKTKTRTFGCSTKWAYKQDWVTKKQKKWDALLVSVEPVTVDQVKSLVANKTGKIRVINVWSTTCGLCIAEFPELIDTYRRYQKRSFDMITISIDPKADADKVQKFLVKEHLPTSPSGKKAMEKEGRKTNNYHYQGNDLDALAEALDTEWQGPIPHTLVIGANGKILFRHNGQIDVVELRRAIVKAIEEL